MTFSDFGEELASFASKMVDFSDNVSTMDFYSIYRFTESVKDLSELSNTLETFNVDAFKKFVDSFDGLSLESIENFCNAFSDAEEGINSSISTFSSLVLMAIETFLPPVTFSEIGNIRMDQFSKGMLSKLSEISQAILYMSSLIISQFKIELPSPTFVNIGSNISGSIGAGISNKRSSAVEASQKTTSAVKTTFQDGLKKSEFDSIGKNVGEGLREGIESKIKDIAKSVIETAKSVINTAKEALGVHSPSTEFFAIGEFLMLGLAYGIRNTTNVVDDETESAAKESISLISEMMASIVELMNNNDFEMTLKVVPVMDMENLDVDLDKSQKELEYRLNLSNLYGDISDIQEFFAQNKKKTEEEERKEKPTQVVNNYAFNQTNNSPKALSEIDIYRNTNNQFSAFKKRVKT